jgi:hypothetical protein
MAHIRQPEESFAIYSQERLGAKLSDDLGLRLVADLYDAMQVDRQWSHFEGRGFSWWPLHLAQRIWAEDVRDDAGEKIWRVHARSEMWGGLASGRAAEALQHLNKTTVLSAAVYEDSGGKVVLRCSIYLHGQNWDWASKLFKVAVAIQANFALFGAQPEEFGAKPDRSAHPTSGLRSERDDILNFTSQVVFQGLTKNDFRAADLKHAMATAPRFWTVGATDHAIAMEVPFATYDTDPTDLKAERTLEEAARRSRTDPSDALRILWFKNEGGDLRGVASANTKIKFGSTALLQVIVDNPHPALGDGALVRLDLPIRPTLQRALQIARQLNTAETIEWVRSHSVGAWSVGPEGYLTHVVFLPAFLKPVDVLPNLLLAASIRVQWATTYVPLRFSG